jgi:hypothetical protein
VAVSAFAAAAEDALVRGDFSALGARPALRDWLG